GKASRTPKGPKASSHASSGRSSFGFVSAITPPLPRSATDGKPCSEGTRSLAPFRPSGPRGPGGLSVRSDRAGGTHQPAGLCPGHDVPRRVGEIRGEREFLLLAAEILRQLQNTLGG